MQNNSGNKTTYIVLLIIIVAAAVSIFYFYKKPVETGEKNNGIINSVVFNCAEDRSIQAIFFKDKVELALSDGRNMFLPQAISASGARYANVDESFVFWNKGDTAFVNEGATTTFKDCLIMTPAEDDQAGTGIANPASVNCVQKGGTLEIRESKAGQYGVCLFEDNRQCEEWALFRGQCPVGGVKITGYENDAEIYCAITGGKVEGVGTPTPMCKRVDGTYCTAQANLDGDCPDPNDPNPNAGNVETP